MKTIKIKLIGFWDDYISELEKSPLFWAIKEHYHIEYSERPDYIICSCFEPFYEYLEYPQIRIMYSGENYIPDFNFIDYAISSYPIHFFDRHFSFPQAFFLRDRCEGFTAEPRNFSLDDIRAKDYFANFISGHESEYGIRGNFFKELCKYKKVESPGTYLNNRDSKEKFSYKSDNKIMFQHRCKFTLCFESTNHPGFFTEKITDAFFADTIPVYYGATDVKRFFNERAFINVGEYSNFEEAIQRIIELDNNEEEYLKMLNEPILKNNDIIRNLYNDLETFVCNIFDQPIESAYRRSRYFYPKRYEDFMIQRLNLHQYLYESAQTTLSGKEMISILNKKLKTRIHNSLTHKSH